MSSSHKPVTYIFQIYFNSAYLGRYLSEIQLPEQCYLLGLVRGNHLIEMSKNPQIAEQDWVVAIALNEILLPELAVYLQQSILHQ
jgi:Trk K+ transport system NAD-binding subunit